MKNPAFFSKNSIDISPGKLKTHMTAAQQTMLNQIGQTWSEIVENSPTKNSYVDRNLINALKDRRLR